MGDGALGVEFDGLWESSMALSGVALFVNSGIVRQGVGGRVVFDGFGQVLADFSN